MPFTSLNLEPSLLKGIKELGFTRPTPIQSQAIPPALEGRDVLACASTGSGKTAAFVLPILHRLLAGPRGKTRALVLTPTRELAAQIVEDLDQLAVHTPLTAAAVFGGVGMGPQEHALRSGVDIVVATPGRLLDHMRASYTRFDGLQHLVLDEADRMLDMGFLPDVRRILQKLPKNRQTLFFSATLPPAINELVRELLHDPVKIQTERQSAPAAGITQAVYPVQQEMKSGLLIALLKRGDIRDALVFTRTKHRANRVAESLAKAGIKTERIHGNRTQAQRTSALAGFKAGRYQVLVATDIAARGIDIQELGHVVNFDVPPVPEDYIHRVGRTARAEATGDAFTFVAPQEEGDLRSIERAIGKRLPRITVPDFDYAARPEQKLEIPLADRLKAMREAKAKQRQGRGRPQGRSSGPGQSRGHHQPARPGRGDDRRFGAPREGGRDAGGRSDAGRGGDFARRDDGQGGNRPPRRRGR